MLACVRVRISHATLMNESQHTWMRLTCMEAGPGDVNLKARRCLASGCTRQPSFGIHTNCRNMCVLYAHTWTEAQEESGEWKRQRLFVRVIQTERGSHSSRNRNSDKNGGRDAGVDRERERESARDRKYANIRAQTHALFVQTHVHKQNQCICLCL